MNSSVSSPPGAPAPARLGDDKNLLEFLDAVLENRWLIAAVVALAIALGIAYALLATPVYRTNTMVQVEEGKGNGAGTLLGEAASLFDIRSPASAEIQILRSRLVLGQAIQNLGLDLKVKPKYLPVFGRWLARHASEPSQPGFLGLSGYVSGSESLQVDRFDAPEAMEGERFRVRLTAHGYALLSPNDELLGEEEIGRQLRFTVDGQEGQLLVSAAVGKPGAEFYVTRLFRLEIVEQLQKDLVIAEEGKQSGVIRASLEGEEPREIARLLNEIGALYVRQNVERKAAEADKTLSFLSAFLPELRKQAEASETRFNQFRNRNSTFDLGTEGRLVLEQTVKLQTSLIELQQKRKELRALYTAEHHSIRALDAQIASIEGELSGLNKRVKALPDMEQALLGLSRDVKVNNELYVNLLNSAQQLRLVKEGKVGNVRIVDVAAVPRKPVKPRRALVVALAAVLGLLSGIALVFVRGSLRTGIRDSSEIEERIGLRVYANVPHSEAQVRQARDAGSLAPGCHVLALADPGDPAVESLRSLRTALQFAMLDATNKFVLVSGPTPGIGKSFTSVNLATLLGAANKKVLLIDADLRKGHLNQYLGVPREGGVSEVVSGALSLHDALHRQVAPNVDFLSTGILPPNPAELLMAPSAAALLAQAAPAYDLILIDTPPVLAASDAAILARGAATVFLVARAGVTTLAQLQESAKRLQDAGAQAKGVIFNDLDISKRRYGYGAGSRYGGYRYT